MNSFLNIITAYNNNRKRTVQELASVYDDYEELVELIKRSIGINLPDSEVNNKSVLLKPNWVKHSSVIDDEICLRTNDKFLIAALEVVLERRPASVIIGDAPIQGCRWDEVVTKKLINEIDNLSLKYNIPVHIEDFRRRTYNPLNNEPEWERRPLTDYLIFDLGKESFLEEITVPGKNIFRVTNYDPDRMLSAHSPGVHKYCITKSFFDADVIISLPKIKTHQKSGITGAVKNIVGINGDKDFLPHHRIGGTGLGGDCYPGSSRLRYISEVLLDKANRRQGKKSFRVWQKLSSLFWKLSLPGDEHRLSAGWYGNDTTWRMVMDLNKISLYGQKDGTLSDIPVRQLYSLCDGIVGGQGDGPLDPKPLPLGVVSFTNDSFLNDRAMALLMGIDVKKIKLLNHPLLSDNKCHLEYNGDEILFDELSSFAVKAEMPRGWRNY